MILYTGGAYQGKRQAVIDRFGFTGPEIYTCHNAIDFSFPVIDRLEEFFFHQIRKGILPSEYLREHLEEFCGQIVIVGDISGGVVPQNAVERLWREETGRATVLLSHHAQQVYRVFCGIETRLK